MNKIEITFNGERLYGLSEVLAYLDKQGERISELEKENAELKERADEADLDGVIFFNQLCKAKEIIKDMLRDIPNRMWYTDDVIKRAEDFIKECEL